MSRQVQLPISSRVILEHTAWDCAQIVLEYLQKGRLQPLWTTYSMREWEGKKKKKAVLGCEKLSPNEELTVWRCYRLVISSSRPNRKGIVLIKMSFGNIKKKKNYKTHHQHALLPKAFRNDSWFPVTPALPWCSMATKMSGAPCGCYAACIWCQMI